MNTAVRTLLAGAAAGRACPAHFESARTTEFVTVVAPNLSELEDVPRTMTSGTGLATPPSIPGEV